MKMGKTVGLILLICFLGLVHSRQVFNVEGDVYCDPCRVQFVTDLSKKLPGATVRVECRDLETKAVTYAAEGATGLDGHYTLEVDGEHENDSCEVSVVKSPRSECSEPMGELGKSRIECTANGGMHAASRYANPIGFMTAAVNPQCGPMLFNMGVQLN